MVRPRLVEVGEHDEAHRTGEPVLADLLLDLRAPLGALSFSCRTARSVRSTSMRWRSTAARWVSTVRP